MEKRGVATKETNTGSESKPSSTKRKLINSNENVPEICVGRTRRQKSLIEIMKTNEDSPTQQVLAAASSQQSVDSEFHLETQTKIDNNNLTKSYSATKSSRSKEILNSDNDFTSKKLKKSSRIQSKGKQEGLTSQTTLNYLKQSPKQEEIQKEISMVIPNQPTRQDSTVYTKAISEMDSEWIMNQLPQFNAFISQIITNITQFSYQNNQTQLSEKHILKLQHQIRYFLFQFLTGSPSSLWSHLYAPHRVSQLMEESNGQYIQLWVRKYYKDIKDKMKSQALFGYVDSDEDFSEYFDTTESDPSIVGKHYEFLLRGKMCQSWKGRSNVLVINGDAGSGKTTALRCALNSLRMEVIEISNSQKRGAADLRKITELTQSCRLQNPIAQQSCQQQQSTKGIGVFFNKINNKSKKNQLPEEEKDEVRLDTKESNKKVIYFPNFDVALDPLFQSEVFKLADNSKIPFILSTSHNKNHRHMASSSDEIEFQPVSQEYFTYIVYSIFTIEDSLRSLHQSPLYIHGLQSSQTSKISHDLETQLLENKEFQLLISEICSKADLNSISGSSLTLISQIVKLFRSDLNTCFSFLQFYAKSISSLDESYLILKALEYLQITNRTISSLSEVFTVTLPSDVLLNSKFFKTGLENTYQMYLLANSEEDKQNQTNSEDIVDLETHLQQLNTYVALDILQRKCCLKETQEKASDQIGKDQENIAGDLFYQSKKLNQYSNCNYQLVRLEDNIETDLHCLLLESKLKQELTISNLFQNSLISILEDVQRNSFIQFYKQYDVLSDRVEKSERIPIRKSQIQQLFSALPILDTIKTCFLVGTARTRSKQNKELKDIQSNPISIVEQGLSKKTYKEFKLMLSQFNLLKRVSFSQNKEQNCIIKNDQKENNFKQVNTLFIQENEQIDDFTASLVKTCNNLIQEGNSQVNCLSKDGSSTIQSQRDDNQNLQNIQEPPILLDQVEQEPIQGQLNHNNICLEGQQVNIVFQTLETNNS